MNHEWLDTIPAAITVCDTHGIIIEMNNKAIEVFQKDGGKKLIGKSLLDCHPDHARIHVEEMLRTQKSNCYTIEKHGAKKLIYQTPWYEDGIYSGFVELSIPIPFEMPHFVRT
jgi:transcriptional regulator with PAS, ATPase and Fis domain